MKKLNTLTENQIRILKISLSKELQLYKSFNGCVPKHEGGDAFRRDIEDITYLLQQLDD